MNLINKMNNGKAAGLDDYTLAIQFFVCILAKLFNSFILIGHIAESFDYRVIRCPFLNVKVACTRYRMMTSEISQLAVLFLNYLRWLY